MTEDRTGKKQIWIDPELKDDIVKARGYIMANTGKNVSNADVLRAWRDAWRKEEKIT